MVERISLKCISNVGERDSLILSNVSARASLVEKSFFPTEALLSERPSLFLSFKLLLSDLASLLFTLLGECVSLDLSLLGDRVSRFLSARVSLISLSGGG